MWWTFDLWTMFISIIIEINTITTEGKSCYIITCICKRIWKTFGWDTYERETTKTMGICAEYFPTSSWTTIRLQYFGTGSSSSSNSWGAAEHAALRVWENMVRFMLAKNRTEQWYFYSAAQPCEATVKNQYRAKIVVDGRDYHMPWQRTKGRRLYRKVDDVEEVEEGDENASNVWQRSLWGKCTSNKCLWGNCTREDA